MPEISYHGYGSSGVLAENFSLNRVRNQIIRVFNPFPVRNALEYMQVKVFPENFTSRVYKIRVVLRVEHSFEFPRFRSNVFFRCSWLPSLTDTSVIDAIQ